MRAQVLHLAAARPVTEQEVSRAWAMHRALVLAEANDPRLLDDPAHQAAANEARATYLRLYQEWCG